MADFKLLLKTWSGWKGYVRQQRTARDAELHTEEVKLTTRKQTYATEHYKLQLMKKCLIAWQLNMEQERLAKALGEEKTKTRSKMAAFLQAASTGNLFGGKEDDETLQHSVRSEESLQKDTQSARDRVEELFMQPAKAWPVPDTGRSDISTQRSKSSLSQSRVGAKPTEPWQLTKKHVHMSKKQIAELVGAPPGKGDEDQKDQTRSTFDLNKTGVKKAWEKKPFVPAVMEHRHAAQQKILETQQKQIQEQQRLIEELQYLQRQQLLQQQLTNQHLAGQQVPSSANAAPPMAHLQNHISALQKQLIEVGGSSRDNTQDVQDTDRSEGPPTLATHRAAGVDTSHTDQIVSTARTESTVNTQRTATSAWSGSTSRSTSTKVTVPENAKHAQFVKGMEARAAERARIKEEREQKRKQAEAEKLAALQAQEEEILKEKEEEKRRRVEAYREKKRLEKQREIDKQRETEHMKELHSYADLHYQKALLKYRGWWPWVRLMQMASEKRQHAELHHRNTLMRKVLVSWHMIVHVEVQRKAGLAESMHQFILVRRCFSNWKKFGESQLILEQKACRHYQVQLKARFVAAWHDYTEDEKMAMWRKERAAKEHNVWRIKKKKVPTATLR